MLATSIFAIGLGATAIYDVWTWLRAGVVGVPMPDWALVGRWVAYLPRGRFAHAPISATPPVRGERALGWLTHGAIGVAYAALLVAVAGPDWLRAPTPGPAFAVGIATVLAPFLLLQPALGAGLFARRTPHPWLARLHALVGHAVFGAGLYLAALAWRALA